jgi:DNA-binding IclR family transcriptional regulator
VRRDVATDEQYDTDLQTDGRTGWRTLTRKPAVSEIVDTLLDLPGHREFTKSELADLAGVSRNTVGTHADLLLAVGLIEEVPHAARYRVNTDSEVFELATKLDVAVRDAVDAAD